MSVAWPTTPGTSTLPAGNFTSSQTRHSCSWRGIGRFDGNRIGFNFKNEVDDVAQRDVVLVRAVITAPAGVKAHPVWRDVAQAVIERVDAQRGILAIFRHAHFRHELPAVGQIGIVDLQQEAGVDDRFVFLVHSVGDGDQIGFIVRIVIVLHPVFDGAGCNGGKKSFFVFLALQARFEILDFRFQRFMADVLERRVAENPPQIVAAMSKSGYENNR